MCYTVVLNKWFPQTPVTNILGARSWRARPAAGLLDVVLQAPTRQRARPVVASAQPLALAWPRESVGRARPGLAASALVDSWEDLARG